MLIVGWQLWQLRRNLKRGVFGSRLAVRLVLLFALVAVLPGALVYAVSVQFIGRSIESWFDVRVDRALEGGPERRPRGARLPAQGHDQQGERMADRARGQPGPVWRGAAARRGAGQALRGGALLADGQRARGRRHAASRATPEPPPAQALRRARLQQSTSEIEQRDERAAAARRRAGEQRRPARAAQAAAGDRAGAARRSRRRPRRCRPACATTRSSRSRATR